jgi:hypothetical protein
MKPPMGQFFCNTEAQGGVDQLLDLSELAAETLAPGA